MDVNVFHNSLRATGQDHVGGSETAEDPEPRRGIPPRIFLRRSKRRLRIGTPVTLWLRLLAVLLVGIVAPAPASADGPRIGFDKESHDYGKVKAGHTVTEEFTVTNQGNALLIIKELRSSCGCTKAIQGSNEIPPHGHTKIVASFDTTGMRAGHKTKAIFVDSNDPERPTMKLLLTADIVRDLALDPPSLAKELPTYAESVSFPIQVTNSSGTPYSISGVKTGASGVKPVLEPATLVIGAGTTAKAVLELRLERDPPRLFYSGTISLITDNPVEPELTIRYLVNLRSAR